MRSNILMTVGLGAALFVAGAAVAPALVQAQEKAENTEETCCKGKGAACDKIKANAKAKAKEGFNQTFALTNLKALKVYVGKLDDECTGLGLSQEKLEHTISDALVPCHLKIVTAASKGCEPSNDPVLYLKLKSDKSDDRLAYSLNLSLVEKLKLQRNKQDLMAPVWTNDCLGVSKSVDAQQKIESSLQDLLKTFTRDYSLANSQDSFHGIKNPHETK